MLLLTSVPSRVVWNSLHVLMLGSLQNGCCAAALIVPRGFDSEGGVHMCGGDVDLCGGADQSGTAVNCDC